MKQFEDRLAKYVMSYLFSEHVRVEIGADLLPDTFYADVMLIPESPLPLVPGAELLCTLTGAARCLIEPFSGMVHQERLEGTISKLRLALQRANNDKVGVDLPEGVLWLVTTYWPHKAIQNVLGPGEEVESGLLKWKGFKRETVYLVNASQIELRDETLLFRLLGNKEKRKEAVWKVFEERFEPYVTLLNQFDMRFKEMIETGKTGQVSQEELKNLQDLRDTREEVLRDLGREDMARQIAQKMLELGEPVEKIASITGLSVEEIRKPS